MPLPLNDPDIEAIAERLRGLIPRAPSQALNEMASILDVPPDSLRRLTEDRTATIDTAFLIEAVAAVVREFAVDPQWLLTGRYDANAHRRALALGENRSDEGRRALREFVREQYLRRRDGLSFLSLPLANGHE